MIGPLLGGFAKHTAFQAPSGISLLKNQQYPDRQEMIEILAFSQNVGDVMGS